MEDACRGAKLVIFVLTKDFLSSSWCMDEMRWTLEERAADLARDPNNKHLQPEILTVLPEAHLPRVPRVSSKQPPTVHLVSKIPAPPGLSELT